MRYKTCIAYTYLFLLSCTTLLSKHDPLLVIVLMVKDEGDAIEETLQPYVEAGVHSFLVFDTGSTDDTMSRAQNYFIEHAISAWHIEQEPFIDFATSRNHALAAALKKFPDAGFILMPDAEWYLHHVDQLLEFCAQELYATEPTYLVRIGTPFFEFYTPRLLRASACADGLIFVGDIHEIPNKVGILKTPFDVYFERRSSPKGIQQSEQRWKRDLEKSLKRYQEDPFNPRTLFYLAQTYECLKDFDHAAQYYKERMQLTGWDEEDYMTLYRLAGVFEEISTGPEAWMRPVYYYLKAYEKRPCRAEPLIKIAQHYMDRDMMSLAFCFARQACELPYPEHDTLFIEKWLYDYVRYDILGRCAWYVGAFEIGEEAVHKALQAQPNFEHLQRNLACYVNRKKNLNPFIQ